MDRVQLLHGLRLQGDVMVPGVATVANGAVDFSVRLDPPLRPEQAPPAGELVAALERPGSGYAAALHDEVLSVRFFQNGDFEVDLARGAIVARPAPGSGMEMVTVLLSGGVLALVLGVRGAAVLHASTVELDGAAIAFAGPTGAGKSTAAALLCATGAPIVGDDTARIDTAGGDSVVHRGSREIRLRSTATALAERIGGATRTTADGRLAVEAEPATGATIRLGAVVFPRWPADARKPSAVRLSPREALEALLRCPRISGWRASAPLRAHLDASARIAQSVPALSMELPAGRLQDPRLAEETRGALADALVSADGPRG